MTDPETRRPLASRSSGWAQSLARRLSASSVTPNQISQASMAAAALAFLAFTGAGFTDGILRGFLLIVGALGCQLRLICNLLDGMVAVEGGKSAPDGPFWNEAPDRVSDILILAGAGIAAHAPILGWMAASFAVLTAYIRELGRAEGQNSDFSGPMAKPQRMAIITIAALIAIAEPAITGTSLALTIALLIIIIGAALTALRRSFRLIASLKSPSSS